jgi:hypothetical protein
MAKETIRSHTSKEILESQIQSSLIKKLRSSGWLVNKLINVSLNGTPDLIAHKLGKTIYIEVKRPGQKPRPLQEYRMKELAEHGIKSITCHNVDECLAELQNII